MGPNYTYVFDFERDFDQEVTKGWFLDNWQTITTYAAGLYILLIFGGQHYMSSRPRMEIRGALILWNAFLAVFSIMGALRTWTEFLHVLSEHGIHHSLCVSSFIEKDRVSGFWTFMFVLSKVPELGDTIFIVLRKQPLIFLH